MDNTTNVSWMLGIKDFYQEKGLKSNCLAKQILTMANDDKNMAPTH